MCIRLGYLKSKSLIENKDKILNLPILDCSTLQKPLLVSKDTNLLEMLMIFQEKKATLAIITDEIRKKKEISNQNSDDIFFSVI